MTATASLATTANWEKTVWLGETAWVSSKNNVRAVVTEARSRLIYLGAADGSHNLLNATWPQVLPGKDNPWPNQGGHRFWLGPQHRWVWPPPADWEHSSVQAATAKDGVLILQHTHDNKAYPALTREYSWEAQRLRCTVRWEDNGQAYFGLHVVAVNTPFVIAAGLKKTADVPAGFVAARTIDPAKPIQLPHPSISLNGDTASVRSDCKNVKLGFAPQALTIDRPQGWKLAVHPGPSSVATDEVPDQGYFSQIWVGDKTHDFAELEQLTPVLKGDASGRCSSTIYIEAIPPLR